MYYGHHLVSGFQTHVRKFVEAFEEYFSVCRSLGFPFTHPLGDTSPTLYGLSLNLDIDYVKYILTSEYCDYPVPYNGLFNQYKSIYAFSYRSVQYSDRIKEGKLLFLMPEVYGLLPFGSNLMFSPAVYSKGMSMYHLRAVVPVILDSYVQRIKNSIEKLKDN